MGAAREDFRAQDMNKEQLKSHIANKLQKKYAGQYRDDPVWAWEQIKEAVKTATPSEKVEIIKRLSNVSIIQRSLNTLADTEADQMLMNDSLDLNELTRILGA